MIKRSENIELSGLTVTHDPPSYFQGRILGYNTQPTVEQVEVVEVEETFEQEGFIEVGTCRSCRLALSSGMQKQRIHHLLLLLALVFGLGATACPVADPKPGEVLQEPLLHLAHQETFEQVGLIQVVGVAP